MIDHTEGADARLRALAGEIVRDVLLRRRSWAAFGINSETLLKAVSLALDDRERDEMRLTFVTRRLRSLLHARMTTTAPPAIPVDLPVDLRNAAARALVETRLVNVRAMRAFAQEGPPMRPIVLRALRHAGLNAAMAAMAMQVRGGEFDLHHPDGRLTLAIRYYPDATSPNSEFIAGVPLGGGARLAMGLDERTFVSIPDIPDSMVSALAGRPLASLVTHPVLPADATIVGVMRTSEIDAVSARGKLGDRLLVDFGCVEPPISHNHLPWTEFDPIPKGG
jgi:hypothetical protein